MAGHSDLEAMFLGESGDEAGAGGGSSRGGGGGGSGGGGDDVDDEPVEELTAGEALDQLQEAWINEKLCPELLPHKAELVEVMMEQVEQMELNVRQLARTDLRCFVHCQELERIKYVMKSYMRSRVLKIETYCLHLLRAHQQQQQQQQLSTTEILEETLSPQEMKYLKEYATNMAVHLNCLLDLMPSPINQFNAREMEAEPDLESHVFARSKVDIAESVVIASAGGADEEVTLRRGSQHILPYSTVRPLVRASKVTLI